MLTHLSAVLGRPVRALNSVGLTYAVVLQPAPKAAPLPSCADLGPRPEGMPYAWPFGVDRAGRQVWQSLDKTGHVLLVGKTGFGKSTELNLALVCFLTSTGQTSCKPCLWTPRA